MVPKLLSRVSLYGPAAGSYSKTSGGGRSESMTSGCLFKSERWRQRICLFVWLEDLHRLSLVQPLGKVVRNDLQIVNLVPMQ